MSSKGKKIFLATSIILPMIIYCYVYYKPIIQNAPFRKNDFVSMQYQWGNQYPLENRYNSVNGEYVFLNTRDSVIQKNVLLKSDDILFMHSKANELGLWNFPDTIGTKEVGVPYFQITFNYKEKSKNVVVYNNFAGNPKLMNAATQMRKAIEEGIRQAEKRSGK